MGRGGGRQFRRFLPRRGPRPRAAYRTIPAGFAPGPVPGAGSRGPRGGLASGRADRPSPAVRWALHDWRSALHAVRDTLHAVRCALHAVSGALHALRGSLHAARGILHAVRGSLHAVRGAMHALRGKLRAIRGEQSSQRCAPHAKRSARQRFRGPQAAFYRPVDRPPPALAPFPTPRRGPGRPRCGAGALGGGRCGARAQRSPLPRHLRNRAVPAQRRCWYPSFPTPRCASAHPTARGRSSAR